MRKLILALIFILISNSILYSQITGISRSQKQEIVKGLKASEEYKKIIDECEVRLETYLTLVNHQDSIIEQKAIQITSKDNIITSKDALIDIERTKVQVREEELKSIKKQLLLLKVATLAGLMALLALLI